VFGHGEHTIRHGLRVISQRVLKVHLALHAGLFRLHAGLRGGIGGGTLRLDFVATTSLDTQAHDWPFKRKPYHFGSELHRKCPRGRERVTSH
jgi:hypothetical protein